MAWAAGATVAAISARCKFIASVLQAGMIRAAPLPSFGQTAPKMYVEAVRWSRGALGRVPRLAQRRVILFFWPMRASSANQISIVSRSSAFLRAIASRRHHAGDGLPLSVVELARLSCRLAIQETVRT